MSWVRIVETTTENRWCWWTLSFEYGHYIYLFSNQTNQVIAKIFLWHWEEETNNAN